mmetsp:Transcript_30067/g.97866  ORF Transcript_30067/g.97866 Transcript_30067/m.97866 type:complete len:2075 (-) Transcript_30067:133-6357(-)|eukprot:CAMPEP_0170145918 /NCGR_PEP_ID=MMETSP0033_2-20121228/26886_1 /TAXON_ID=195969 /ORGANISM="Dolichomastix tenuilepis, Strain CCMP3274" /LENGTH=2074 /DNA_ID=CAMNT_0010382571 /DNA_START=21 /DNA_END=6245 /DNA_ORIENTATION=+
MPDQSTAEEMPAVAPEASPAPVSGKDGSKTALSTHPASPSRPSRQTSHKLSIVGSGKGGRRRTVFVPQAREMERGKFAFLKEIITVRKTILKKVLPQILLSFIMGVFANWLKTYTCGDNVKTFEDCSLTFSPESHLMVGVAVALLLVFRTNLAYDRYDAGKSSLGEIYSGLRNVNVAFTAFMRISQSGEVGHSHSNDSMASKLSRDRVEMLRLTNLMYGFIRQSIREQRHGYSDSGPVSDGELLSRDRAGKPRIPDLLRDAKEHSEFAKIDPANRANICMARIMSMVEHHRRLGHLSERASLDIFHDLEMVMAAFKSCEKIVTTPIPYPYLHMVQFLTFFFVYTVPLVFSASFKWVTPFPSAIISLGYYGINEIGRCMEDPFSWEEPCHDISGIGWRIYRENTQLHEKVDKMDKEDALKGKVTVADRLKAVMKIAPALQAALDAKAEEEEDLAMLERNAVTSQGFEAEDDDDDLEVMETGQQELSTAWHAFFTELFVVKNTITPRILPQIITAFFLGFLANYLKIAFCGDDVEEAAECWITFTNTAHSIVGVPLGFLLVFRVDLAYDRFYEGKESLGTVYSSLRNLNVSFAAFMRQHREDEPGYTVMHNTQKQKEELEEDRMELLRLSNLMFCTMRLAIRENRIGYADGVVLTDREIVSQDSFGNPATHKLLKADENELDKLLSVAVFNRPNWIMARMQMIVEHHRRVGTMSERAAFEVYQNLEELLGAFKACERIVTTPIPYTYLHMASFILFFFVYSSPFVFSATFKWVAPGPSVIIALGFYGINEMGRVMQDPFKWEAPCHDLTQLGFRIYKENLQIHTTLAAIEEEQVTSLASIASAVKGSRMLKVLQEAMAAAETSTVETAPRDRRKSTSTLGSNVEKEKSGQELEGGMFSFIAVIFIWRNTVLVRLLPQLVMAVIVGIIAQQLKLIACGEDVVLDTDCWITFDDNAHQVAGGILGFLLVIRTNIAYYRYYEGKKFLGAMYNALRNVNVGFNSFFRMNRDGETGYDANLSEKHQAELTRDHIELRRLSNLLFAFIRQAVREKRHGYPDGTHPKDSELLREDKMGRPSLALLLTEREKAEFAKVDFNNRPNVVVAHMQTIVEHHRRLGFVSERGAFDIYHDLEAALESFKNCERIVSTKMPYQYLHMVYFMVFIFTYSSPFIFSWSFKYITWLPSLIVTLAFYGIAEIGRSIEDPFSWIEPSHDLSGVGWRVFTENLQLHEMCAVDRESARGTVDQLVLAEVVPKETIAMSQPHSHESRRSFRTTQLQPDVALKMTGPREVNTAWYGFITEVFNITDTVHPRIAPQLALAALMGVIAQYGKIYSCGHGVEDDSECWITFAHYAHTVVGAVLGFMLVFRTDLAYSRYYEAKTAIGQLHNGIRNFNIGVCAFLRVHKENEPEFNPEIDTPELEAALSKERVELLRLSGMLFAFVRHILREQRIGYPGKVLPGDKQLLATDSYGKPSLGSLLTKEEIKEFSRMPFQNRHNIIVTKIQMIVEHYRRLGCICERGAFDLYHECELVLEAVKSCERVVTTPIPYQYLHMVNFVTFCFVFSAPFTFTDSFKYIAWFPSALLALEYYGTTIIGESIERPFDWEEPNHDLTGLGWRIWRETVQIHKVSAQSSTSSEGLEELEDLESKADKRPDLESVMSSLPASGRKEIGQRRASVVKEAEMLQSQQFPRERWSFFTEVFQLDNTVLLKVFPQVVLAGFVGLFANILKTEVCGDEVDEETDCDITFNSTAHAMTGSILGFLLVFCNNLNYTKYYDGKISMGNIFEGLRNINIAFAAFLREAIPGELNYERTAGKGGARLKEDCTELRRLSNIFFAFLRQSIREQRHGYGDKQNAVSDEELLSVDAMGTPSLESLLTEKERAYFLGVDFNNRANLVCASIQRLVERQRRQGFMYEKAAFDVYHESENVLARFKTCEKIVTTPVPYQYLHMLNLVLFFFVYSAPFVFSASFKWVTPFPSAVLALGFYGIAEIGKVVADPFNWQDPRHDLSGIGRRLQSETQAIWSYSRSLKLTFAKATGPDDDTEITTIDASTAPKIAGPIVEAFSEPETERLPGATTSSA